MAFAPPRFQRRRAMSQLTEELPFAPRLSGAEFVGLVGDEGLVDDVGQHFTISTCVSPRGHYSAVYRTVNPPPEKKVKGRL